MAEVDEGALPSGVRLDDCLTEMNREMNNAIRSGRASKLSGTALSDHVFGQIGQVHIIQRHKALIEKWIDDNLKEATKSTAGKKFTTPLASTRFAGAGAVSNTWAFAGQGALAPLIKCNGVVMGSDKIGHFFQLGHDLYKFQKGIPAASRAARSGTFNTTSEMGNFGIGITGVFSNGDIAANSAGAQFYHDLERSSSGTMDLSRYIKSDWNESTNQNFYDSAIGKVVWNNLIEGAWSGTFTNTHGAISITGTFKKTATDRFDLTFNYTSSSRTVTGTMPCQMTYKTTGAGLVEGVELTGTWTSGGNSGKARFLSTNETTLDGTWGSGASEVDGGMWHFEK